MSTIDTTATKARIASQTIAELKAEVERLATVLESHPTSTLSLAEHAKAARALVRRLGLA